MQTKISVHHTKLFNLIVIATSLFIFGTAIINAQGFKTITSLSPVTATASTGEKPQSKVWFYQGYWFTVIPVPSGFDGSGTYVYRLDGTSWTQRLKISDSTLVKADVKVNEATGTTYILLKNSYTNEDIPLSQTASLISINYSAGSYTVGSTTSIPLDDYCETATIDIDSNGRMWLASDGAGTSNSLGVKNILVRYSESPYGSFSTPIPIATGVSFDDICAVTAFSDDEGNKIGILWSDQILKKFGFAYHNDSEDVTTWQFETAALDTSSGGVGDDHMNFAVASDGTIYVAVKTSFTLATLPTIGLLVRPPAGPWDPIYPVTKYGDASKGTRPIVLLNESENVITVAYTERDGWHDLVYKESPTNTISFPATRNQFLSYSNIDLNNISSTKQNYSDNVVFLFSRASDVWESVIAKRTGLITTDGAGYSLGFDGEDQLRVVSNPSINITGALTIEAWIKPNATKNQSILNKFSNKTIPNRGYELSLNDAGKIKFAINGIVLLSNSSYELGTWTHIAVTYNTTSGMSIYINGVLDNSYTTNGAITVAVVDYLYIGFISTDQFFNGSLDEIRLWNKEKTIDEIRADMCKKLTGSESNLVGYWNFDTEEGLNVPDLTSNDNYATMYSNSITMNNYLYSWSGASIGDASAYDYTGSGGVFSQSLSHSDGDSITATTTGGTITGLQVYRVDSPPLRSGASNTSATYTTIDPIRYWGVKVFGTSPIYTLTYNYDGHPGITDESGLNLLFRDNLSDDTWAEFVPIATLDQVANTLTKTWETGTEFALASSNDDPLPVELSLFNAIKLETGVKLTWRTETEVNNYGFEVERTSNVKGQTSDSWENIGFVNGNGNSNSPKDYSFFDELNSSYGIYYYRLKQIDNDGKYEYSKVISVDLGIPSSFSLSQNYPNPFNPATTINFTLPVNTFVTLKVYDILGNEVAILENEEKEAGYYEVDFDAKGLASGIYFYNISAGEFYLTKKMLLLK